MPTAKLMTTINSPLTEQRRYTVKKISRTNLITQAVFLISMALFGAKAMAAPPEQSQSNNNPAAIKNPSKDPEYPFCMYESLTFNNATDIFSFDIARTEDTAAGTLRIRTEDCCIAGDRWTASLNGIQPANKESANTSDGNTSYFNGDAFLSPSKKAELKISYDKGVDTFPAGMTVEICYSRKGAHGGDPITVQPN